MDCDGLERIIDYTFKDRNLLNEALHQTQNKRLALLGDKVVALMLIDSWYQTGGSCYDGNSLLQHAASNEAMANRAIQTHLKDMVRRQSHQSPSTHGLATDFEAVVGAVWIDCGKDLQTLEKVIRQLYVE
ncbi:dsRNA-specific ribonuclease III, putative [Talaromyces stipitatus ATCC 10500]|uniref:DsRNA-specific ribonuclease III, putative n=1 Tax=Talaromyces stipitatus (strain ATCC 10500 / CBS 375.48 / QM 6759 / NRRL 1006) TaxID=441959 RepID=B8MS18_TALSN|nr:dsRNA-specific ribonuclease III, putative [Talaromyces stipitatus ATCC 10500]EED12063.1 dsRNA-specific ribonuclease III, putative [Talaromyces stipitatus ATCC 10500]